MTNRTTPIRYLHDSLDRLVERRRDAAWMAERLSDPATQLVPVWQSRNLVSGPKEAPRAVFAAPGDSWLPADLGDPVLLGDVDGHVHIAVDVGAIDDIEAIPESVGRFRDLRSMGWLLPQGEGALLAQARGVIWWHQRHRFCGVCGSPTRSTEAGTSRTCTSESCGAVSFPRLDPAVIVLIYHGDEILLGRQPVWPAGMHSVLAGFVEPGENLEACVAREVFEESGVRVTDVRYAGSQPWPFPQSIMLAFTARALNRDLVIDVEELETAAWYDRATLEAAADAVVGQDAFALPSRHSIARWLVDGWLAGDLPAD